MMRLLCVLLVVTCGALAQFATEDVEVGKDDLAALLGKTHSRQAIYCGETLSIPYPTAGSPIFRKQNTVHFEFQFLSGRQFGLPELAASLKRDLGAKITFESMQAMATSCARQPIDLLGSVEFGKHVLESIAPLSDVAQQRETLLSEGCTFAPLRVPLLEVQKMLAENFAFLSDSLSPGSGLFLEKDELEQALGNVSLSSECALLVLSGEGLSTVCRRHFSASAVLTGTFSDQRIPFLAEIFGSFDSASDGSLKRDVISVDKDELIRHINSNFFIRSSIAFGKKLTTDAQGSSSFNMQESEIDPFFLKTSEFKVPNIPGTTAKLCLVEYLAFVLANASTRGNSAKDSVRLLFFHADNEKYLKGFYELKLSQKVSLEMPQKQLERLILDCIFETGILKDHSDAQITDAYKKNLDFHFSSHLLTVSGLLHDKTLASSVEKISLYAEFTVEKELAYYSARGLSIKNPKCMFDVTERFKKSANLQQFNQVQATKAGIENVPTDSTNDVLKTPANSSADSDWKPPPKEQSEVRKKPKYVWLLVIIGVPSLIIILCLVYLNYSSLRKFISRRKSAKKPEI